MKYVSNTENHDYNIADTRLCDINAMNTKNPSMSNTKVRVWATIHAQTCSKKSRDKQEQMQTDRDITSPTETPAAAAILSKERDLSWAGARYTWGY
jgi:hypothetical protein